MFKKPLRFEKTLLDIAIRLVACPFSDLNNEINTVLSESASFCGVDELHLYHTFSDDSQFRLLNSYVAPHLKKNCNRNQTGFISWSLDRVRSGTTVVLTDFKNSVSGSGIDHIIDDDAQSLSLALAFPLKIEGAVHGCLVVLSFQESRQLAPDLKKILTYLGEILASALERLRSGFQLHDHLRFETLLSDISSTYLNAAPAEVEQIIRDDLGRLAQFFGTDRCALYLFDKESNSYRFDISLMWWPKEDNAFFDDLGEWFNERSDMQQHFHFHFNQWHKGKPQELSSLDELPPEASQLKEFYQRFGVKSALSIPFGTEESPLGALVITDTRKTHQWPKSLFSRLRLCGEVFGNALARKYSEENLQKAFHKIEQLKDRFESDYLYLKEETSLDLNFNEFIGENEILQKIKLQIGQVASTNTTVLLLGETGTGKGVIAKIIHNMSPRGERPLIKVNCAALSPQLIESELFGHEKGAFTGAMSRRAGRFEFASGSTIFLDEIGELAPNLQAKLLRVIQDKEFERVGGNTTLKTDVRIIAATNKDLKMEVERGAFREDLWYRLSVFPIFIPPLRDRLDDIPLFVSRFVANFGNEIGKQFERIPKQALEKLQNYQWPGNVRELENIIERAVISSPEGQLKVDIPTVQGMNEEIDCSLQHTERNHILRILEQQNWVIEGPAGASRVLGLNPGTLRSRMKKLNIARPVT